MPILKGKSQKIRSLNIAELTKTKAGKVREKAIRTLMKRRNLSYRKAKQLQAKAIAFSQ